MSAFARLTIIDATDGVAGGYCTRLLAGFGADVIKIEPPGCGDRLRRTGPFPGDAPHVETSALHLHLNAAKRSVTLDIRTASGRALLRALARDADVVIADDAPVLDDIHAHQAAGHRPLLV